MGSTIEKDGKRYRNLTGMRFGSLVVLKQVENNERSETQWLCLCDCGRECVKAGWRLTGGRTKSCGCLKKRCFGKKHGLYDTRLYGIYRSMKARCYNKHRKEYTNYGGRGIVVCDEWRNNFAAFYNWAIEHGYDKDAPHHVCTLDRIDNDGNYEPENCRWVDMKVQNHNRRTVHYRNQYSRRDV